jgi:dTDP-4-amino-4,6-dideoxygalactose transaminase
VGGPMPVCDGVSARMMSLPLLDTMSNDEVDQVVACLHEVIAAAQDRWRPRPSRAERHVAQV